MAHILAESFQDEFEAFHIPVYDLGTLFLPLLDKSVFPEVPRCGVIIETASVLDRLSNGIVKVKVTQLGVWTVDK